ncbi:MAG: MBL fold metallo-hydrolase [Streptosporangiales bacterium]|nr:MBL fold metallo-hydrolase [Streptosporangiales bacterium]
MGTIHDLAERCWNGEADLVHEHHPVHTWQDGTEEIADGLLFYKGLASANTLDTGDGLVMLDTGSQVDTDRLHGEVRRWRPAAPLAAAVFSHHHVDHVFGVAPFERDARDAGVPAPTVYGHAGIGPNFDRYRRTLGLNTTLNRRQFAIDAPGFRWPETYRHPDVTYADRLTFRHGEVYLGEWATALRTMAGLGAEIMLAGHGLPIFGADRIRQALSDTADLLRSLEDQTIALMNQGLRLDTILHEVTVPERLRDRPYLQAVYDHPQFLVRNVWRRYGGWYDGEPDRLLPAPRTAEAAEWVALAGGVGTVLARAAELLDTGGDARLACHLAEAAVAARPENSRAHEIRARAYEAHAEAQTSSMARNILRHAANSSRQGLRDLASGT